MDLGLILGGSQWILVDLKWILDGSWLDLGWIFVNWLDLEWILEDLEHARIFRGSCRILGGS